MDIAAEVAADTDQTIPDTVSVPPAGYGLLLTACLVAHLALALVLIGDVAFHWHRRPAPAASACEPEVER